MSGSIYDKPGNATWAQCPSCDHWFHVSPTLLAMDGVDLICPGCANRSRRPTPRR